jgi:hypothetical protein
LLNSNRPLWGQRVAPSSCQKCLRTQHVIFEPAAQLISPPTYAIAVYAIAAYAITFR